MTTHYRSGEWAAQCDRCGFDFYASELRLEWTGLRVCSKCFDYRHPQEFVRGLTDRARPPWTQPESPDVFLEPNQVSYSSGFDDGFDEGFGGSAAASIDSGVSTPGSFDSSFDASFG